jgi:hypothetical protein
MVNTTTIAHARQGVPHAGCAAAPGAMAAASAASPHGPQGD